ncbi:hypothetical protein [Vulcanisaeta distributa]|uniref:hypothetical protein n=1 Tax=Vulcanisaeta distributa TaxID=164451 RepID=UPI0006D058F6|nr:hypothetical protein [Vulcanisaeta distributa]
MASANNTEAIDKLRKISQLIKYGLTVKMTECAERNYDKITKNAIDSLARLFPELINDVNDTLNKLILVQKAVKELNKPAK